LAAFFILAESSDVRFWRLLVEGPDDALQIVIDIGTEDRLTLVPIQGRPETYVDFISVGESLAPNAADRRLAAACTIFARLCRA
jgi:hypothetical protein